MGHATAPSRRREKGARSNSHAVQRLVHTLHDGQRTKPPPHHEKLDVKTLQVANIRDELVPHETKSASSSQQKSQ